MEQYLWLVLLLSERPMYGYEIIRELEKRFSGYWKPKTGTIYPALEKLERARIVTSRIEFREEAPDRKHYAITEKGRRELGETVEYWIKMFQILEHHREEHESLFYHRGEMLRGDASRILSTLGSGIGADKPVELKSLFPSEKKRTMKVQMKPIDPVSLRLLCEGT